MKDEGPKEMTLDEWKAMQDKERAKVEFNIRKVKEGDDWNQGFVLHKSKLGVSQTKTLLILNKPLCVSVSVINSTVVGAAYLVLLLGIT